MLRKGFDYALVNDDSVMSNPSSIEVKTFTFYKAELKKLSEEEEIYDDELCEIISCIINLYNRNDIVWQINKIQHFKGADAVIGEFYKDRNTNEVYFVCNANMGEISWYNAANGSLVETRFEEHELIVDYKRLGDYLYILCYGYFGDGDYTRILDLQSRELHYVEHIPQSKENAFDLYECNDVAEFLHKRFEIFTQREYNFKKDLFNLNRNSKDTLLRIFLEHPDVNFNGDSRSKLQNLLDNKADKFTCNCFGNISNKRIDHDRKLYEVINFESDKKIIGKYRETITKTDTLNYLVTKVLFGGFIRMLPIENGAINLHFSITSASVDAETNIEIDISQQLMSDEDLRYQVDPTEKCQIDFY